MQATRMDDCGLMTRREVEREEQRLRELARVIFRQVKDAAAAGEPLPWMSRDTGVDMSYDFERWRRWEALSKEMSQASAHIVADLGRSRVSYWQSALDPESLSGAAPLTAFQPVKPLVRHIDAAARRHPRPDGRS